MAYRGHARRRPSYGWARPIKPAPLKYRASSNTRASTFDHGSQCAPRPTGADADAGLHRPRGARDHLLDFRRQHLAQLVAHRALMEPRIAVAAAPAAGLPTALIVSARGRKPVLPLSVFIPHSLPAAVTLKP